MSQGSALVYSGGDALSQIVAAVLDVVRGINGILTASQEQATGISEITQAVSDIDRTTSQTAALSEESAASASQLAERANQLRELVSFFGYHGKSGSSIVHKFEVGESAPPAPGAIT